MPDQCTREVAPPPATGTPIGGLLSSGFQRSPRIGAPHLAEQEDPVFSLVRSHGRHFIGSGGRSEAPGCRDWILRHPAHLGTDPATASPHSLCRARRRLVARSQPLDLFAIQFLPARQGAEPSVSRQVLRWPPTRF